MLNILMPVDFSESSLNALSYSAQMTKALHGTLILLHVVEPIGGDATMFVDDRMIGQEVSEAQARLEELKSNFTDIDPALIKIIVTTGFPIEKVLSSAKEENVSLIVMGTGGTNNAFQDILGSNTYNVVKKARCAVLTVPLQSGPFKIKKISMAVDLHKRENIHLMTIARHIARHFMAEIFFLHITKEHNISLENDVKAEAVLWLSDEFKEFKHTYVTLSSENIANAINEYALKNDTDLLVLSSEKHGLFSLLFKGSTTRQLVLHSHVPLLTLPADY